MTDKRLWAYAISIYTQHIFLVQKLICVSLIDLDIALKNMPIHYTTLPRIGNDVLGVARPGIQLFENIGEYWKGYYIQYGDIQLEALAIFFLYFEEKSKF